MTGEAEARARVIERRAGRMHGGNVVAEALLLGSAQALRTEWAPQHHCACRLRWPGLRSAHGRAEAVDRWLRGRGARRRAE